MRFIGIDIGDGESAATMVSQNGAMMPTVINLGHVSSILSIVGMLGGHPVIGDDVLLNAAVQNRSSRFKSRFLFDPTATEEIRLFALGLYEQIRKHSAALDGDQLSIALGCPAGWTEEDKQRYGAIVMSAGFSNLHTVSESRAAFLYARHSNELNLSPELIARPTLVIDIGSSTTDFAYIVDGKESNIGVFGDVKLGGGLLDKLILDAAVGVSPHREALSLLFMQSTSWRSYCELHARRLKEDYFSNEVLWKTKPCRAVAPVAADVNKPLSLTLEVDAAQMEHLLNTPIKALSEQSFIQTLEQALAHAQKHTMAYPPELLILTGGASRMRFFQDACKAAFPKATVALCEEPEFSIARGLSIAARTDYQLACFSADLRVFFEGNEIQGEINQNLAALLAKLVPYLVTTLIDRCVLPATNMVGKGGINSAAQLQSAILKNMEQFFNKQEDNPRIDEVVSEWVSSNLINVQNRLNEICDRYQVDRADMALKNIRAEARLDTVNIPFMARIISNLSGVLKLPVIGNGIAVFLSGLMRGERATNMLAAQLTQAMSQSNGAFARQIATELRTVLTKQIERHMRKVEIRIS